MKPWIYIFGSCLLMFSCVVSAAGNGGGRITSVGAIQGGVVIFKTEIHDNFPSCATIPGDWAITTDQPAGKALYALLLTAVSQGKTVEVSGTGACEAWGDRETAAQLWINY